MNRRRIGEAVKDKPRGFLPHKIVLEDIVEKSMKAVTARSVSSRRPLIAQFLPSLMVLLAFSFPGLCQSAPTTQSFPLVTTKDLELVNVKAVAVEYQGRKAVRLTNDSGKDGFALLHDTNFQDGTIEADIALRTTTPPGVRMPGFVGIAFRARHDASRYELFYLRPGNAVSEDQAMRNHSVQYVSMPDFDWYELRREWPWTYESYADLQMGTWMHVRIEVKGRLAKLYIGRSKNPSLIVEGLKGQDLRGGIALWPYAGEEAYFSNVRIANSASLPVKNGADADGLWHVKFSSDAGTFDDALQLHRSGDKLSGTWSGSLGDERPVSGTWRDGYIELSFDALWPSGGLGVPGPARAVLAGWIDGNTATGRMRVEGRADGKWTALLK